MPETLSIDFETASTADLRRAGAHAYARHPDTRVLCMSYRFDNGPVQRWKPGEPFPQRVLDHVARRRPVQGWNVGFEWVIYNHVLRRQLPGGLNTPELELDQLRDTMARAAYWGLPLSLDQASRALSLALIKDKDGHALMMRMNKPRSYDKATGAAIWWHETDPAKLDRLQDYCDRDVLVESTIAEMLPPLPDDEQAYWEMDQRINSRGVALDTDLVDKLLALAANGKSNADDYLKAITNGAVPSVSNVGLMLPFLKSIGYPYDDLTKGNVERRLDEPGIRDLEREVLSIRQDAGKTSAAKLKTMVSAQYRGRIMGMLQFYGASRTGRWAGRLVQLQNMPRGTVKKIAEAIQAVKNGMDISLLEAFFGPVLGIVSSALRGCLVAGKGKLLVVADFSQIEARVVAWLAGQQDILDVFASGQDVYVYTANRIGSKDRQLGKVLVLACGFGMSGSKFRATAAGYRLTLSEDEADAAVAQWRKANNKIVNFWWRCDDAAKAVIQNADSNGNHPPLDVGPVAFAMWRGHMLIRLPSGRKLVYRDARLEKDHSGPHGREGVTYMGVDQYTRQWKRLRTYGGKLVENITQAVARDVMAEATLQAEKAHGLDVELLVHDELVGEADAANAQHQLDLLLLAMRTPPAWAPGLPVDGAGWIGDRYKK